MDKHELVEGVVRCLAGVAMLAFIIFFGYVMMSDAEVMLGG